MWCLTCTTVKASRSFVCFEGEGTHAGGVFCVWPYWPSHVGWCPLRFAYLVLWQ